MKKDTGIKRKVDGLGRIVIPIEIRRRLDIADRDPLEITVTEDGIRLRKPVDVCVLCRGTDGLRPFMERLVCSTCRSDTDSFVAFKHRWNRPVE